jgi:hypothetical protein
VLSQAFANNCADANLLQHRNSIWALIRPRMSNPQVGFMLKEITGFAHAILLQDEVDVAPFGETTKIGHLVRIGPNAPALDHLDIAIGDAVAEKQER